MTGPVLIAVAEIGDWLGSWSLKKSNQEKNLIPKREGVNRYDSIKAFAPPSIPVSMWNLRTIKATEYG